MLAKHNLFRKNKHLKDVDSFQFLFLVDNGQCFF